MTASAPAPATMSAFSAAIAAARRISGSSASVRGRAHTSRDVIRFALRTIGRVRGVFHEFFKFRAALFTFIFINRHFTSLFFVFTGRSTRRRAKSLSRRILYIHTSNAQGRLTLALGKSTRARQNLRTVPRQEKENADQTRGSIGILRITSQLRTRRRSTTQNQRYCID